MTLNVQDKLGHTFGEKFPMFGHSDSVSDRNMGINQ